MQPFIRTLTSRWVITAFGAIAAAVMLWLYGPLMSGLEGWMPRIAAMVVMTCVWLAVNMGIDIWRRRLDQALARGVTGSSSSKGPTSKDNAAKDNAGAEDLAELKDRLTRALALLRRARGTRGYLYEQPWYAIIGPPGSGKTTALANAGLRFPLADQLNGGEVRGVGGTRFCDWSFTDEAVLIDTAGRYTTQDSEAAVDRAGWEGFLDLLRRTRKRQPLNGVIVTIAASDLAQQSEPERRAHARAIRTRIQELYTKLAVRIPVYVMFTKLDLVQGFTDFFDDLDRERRAQVWGMTFPLTTDVAGPAPAFVSEFQALTAQLSARVIDRLQAERSPERRTAIADFPWQFASLEAPLTAFIDAAFTGTRLDPACLLRGIYFASGTQEGSPIDRLTGSLARSFGIDQRRAAPLRPTQGRGYFLETLFKRVIFGEAMLVVRNPAAMRRRLWLRGTAWGLTGTAIVVGVGGLWFTASQAASSAKRFDAALTQYQLAAAALHLSPVPLAAADLPQVAPLLDLGRGLHAAADAGSDSIALGLTQRDKLATAADIIYRRDLEFVLLPRLVSTVEARMHSLGGDLDGLYAATRVYLILCGQGPMDRAMVRDWLQADWAKTYASASLAGLRSDLSTHLQALLDRPISHFVTLDSDLLARSQARLANISVADRAYALLRAHAAATPPPAFIPADVMGALAGEHFTRTSGRSLQDPIPGLFTTSGYQSAILPGMANATEQAIRESWVLGQASSIAAADVASRQKLEHDVLARYARDYQTIWDDLLNDLQVIPPKDSNSAVTDFSLLTSPQGPIKLLLTAMVKEFSLTRAPTDSATPADKTTPPKTPLPADPTISALEEHFRDLRIFVEGGQINVVLAAVDRLQQQIAEQVASNASGGGPTSAPGIDAAQALRQAAASAPQPVARWLQTLARRGGAVRDDASRQAAAAAYGGAGGPLPLCQDVVQRFPFRPAAHDDVPITSFADLFAPNGRLDTFYEKFVRPFVDSSKPDWRLRDPANTQAPVTPDGVSQFQRARTIRDAFFGLGGTQPQVHFALRPVSMDRLANQVTLDFGGIAASWKSANPTGAQTFDWPGPTHMTSISVNFDPSLSGPDVKETGPWALFRFLKDAKLDRAGGGDDFVLTVQQGDRQATFNLSAASTHSPFDMSLLANFRCPTLRQ